MSEKVYIRNHRVETPYGEYTDVLMSFPDNKSGLWYKRIGRLGHHSIGFFDALVDLGERSVDRILTLVASAVKFILVIIAVLMVLIVGYPIKLICIFLCKFLEISWKRMGWERVSQPIINPRELLFSMSSQCDYSPRQLAMVGEIKELVEKHNLIHLDKLEESNFPYNACNIAEELLQSGKPGAQFTEDLRKIIRLADSLGREEVGECP